MRAKFEILVDTNAEAFKTLGWSVDTTDDIQSALGDKDCFKLGTIEAKVPDGQDLDRVRRNMQMAFENGVWLRRVVMSIGIMLVGISAAQACEFDGQIQAEARRQGVPGWVAVAICHAESSGNPGAVGPGGEIGLFQLRPEFAPRWARLGDLHSNQHQEAWGRGIGETRQAKPGKNGVLVGAGHGLFEPGTNIRAGIGHLAQAKTQDPRQLVCWHNAGRKDWQRLNPKWTVNHPNKIYRNIYRTGAPHVDRH